METKGSYALRPTITLGMMSQLIPQHAVGRNNSELFARLVVASSTVVAEEEEDAVATRRGPRRLGMTRGTGVYCEGAHGGHQDECLSLGVRTASSVGRARLRLSSRPYSVWIRAMLPLHVEPVQH